MECRLPLSSLETAMSSSAMPVVRCPKDLGSDNTTLASLDVKHVTRILRSYYASVQGGPLWPVSSLGDTVLSYEKFLEITFVYNRVDYINPNGSSYRHHSLCRSIAMKAVSVIVSLVWLGKASSSVMDVFAILACVAAVAVAAPQYAYETPAPPHETAPDPLQSEIVPILKDDRIQEDDGRYSVDVETGNGIKLSESGSPDGPEGAIIKAGQYEYTAPDGTLVQLKFVANENGFQPQSDLLPVAPEFPHPIPDFVLEQIEFAAQEAAAAEAAGVTGGAEGAVGAVGAEGAEAGTVETVVTPSQFYSSP
ncbi:uncharacterized protein LOC125025483 [Penaeus chinensis]|uniref:uncharacterized protein LOC125025483 n=1 Tax=Penaeus chinensis TaxID=139456 RepID=UPI001FB62CDE|nr:uncharacterized protein LOC125025483 [Penaeus chinensis]